MIPIDELTTPLTEDQVFESFLQILEDLSVPARTWRKGGARRTILRVVARTYAGFTSLMAAAIKAGFLDTATGPWLTLLAYYVYGVTRIPATFATGLLSFTNTGGGMYSYSPDEVRILNTATGKAYRNTSSFTLNPGDTNIYVDVEAVEAGSASSATPDTVTQLETTILGVTVTNPVALVGTDEESDEALRQRCRDKLSTLSPRGPRGAYRYAVLSAKRLDGSPVDINRVQVSSDPETGVVTLYAASPSGAPSAEDLDAARLNIEEVARPDTVTVNLYAATPVAVASALTVWATRTEGIGVDDYREDVLLALAKDISLYPIGGIAKPPSTQGYLYGDHIAGVAEAANPSIFDVDGADDDIALAPGEVPVLSATVDVRIVEGGTS